MEQEIENFLEKFFENEKKVIAFNAEFIEENGFDYITDIDFIKINRFITVAYNTISTIDPKVIDGLITKFFKDLVFLNKFYQEFKKKSSKIDSVYKKFVSSYGTVCTLAEACNIRGDSNNIDELDNTIRGIFDKKFEEIIEDINNDLRLIINTKTYYFDKLLWYEALKSRAVWDFFQKTKSKNIKNGERPSTKTFINQYLQTLDKDSIADSAWHLDIQQIARTMD